MKRFLTVEDVIVLHSKLIAKSGGSIGIRDKTLIDSALNRAFGTFDGVDLYGSFDGKIAAITYSLINNHGFIDGNKRIGIAVMLLLLRLNGIKIQYKQDELVELGLGIASGIIDEGSIRAWITEHLT